jgi:predicted lipoprotein with Yx(FWY)xxD motif
MSLNRTVLASAIVAVGLSASPVILATESVAATGPGRSVAHVRAHTAAAGATIKLRKTGRGTLLVNSRGFTLYSFSKDGKRINRCQKISGCTSSWPVVKTRGRPRAGHGVKRSKLGTIKLANGTTQVTYAGHPLYTYSGDSGPGKTSYVGVKAFGGTWYAINASGGTVK